MAVTKQKVVFKFGTRAEYDALQTKQGNCLYFLLDTNELYRGDIPFSTPHVYRGLYGDAENINEAIDNVIGDLPIKDGDIAIVTNSDLSQDSYIWVAADEEWVHIGNTNTTNLSQRVIQLENTVADLEGVLYGDPQDPTADDGLIDRVANLEAVIESLPSSSIPVFDGAISGLVPVDDEELTDQEKAKHFLNAMGHWVEVSGGSGGQSTYVDPEGNTYNNVEDYVTYMIENYGDQYWESMDPD